uniref:Uncharacterized protein n=1 Tax=Panagrolaimus superbus TaxID=310955 RepID=A0A914YVS4_9BILA
MTRWSSTFLLFSIFLISSYAQFNPYQQRYQYGNNNINNNLQAQQQQQPNRQYNTNTQRLNQAGQPMYPNQQQQPQQQQQYYSQQQLQQQQQQNSQMNYGQNQFGQNQYKNNQNRNSGGGLLGNPIRPSNSAFGNSSSPDGRALFVIRIVSYSIGRVDPACATTTCSYSFSIVMATLSATVNYESSNFFPLNGSSLTDGGWKDEIMINVTTKPVSVDIFVHSRGLTIGQVDGNYSLGVPVQHVNTFILDLRNYMPFGQNASVSPTPVQLQDSKPAGNMGNTGATIQIEYFVQCLNGFLGPDCDYTCTKVGNSNLAQCKSILNPKEQHACKYDSGYTQIAKDTCDYCSQGFANNGSCLAIGYSSGAVGVSHAYKVWTIVLACLLAIALLLILLLVMLKIITDSRNRRAQQYPQNRNQPSQNEAYRPNSNNGETPLLGGTEKEWERERRPITAVNRQPLQPVDDSIQNSEAYPDNRVGHYVAAQSRREAQV